LIGDQFPFFENLKKFFYNKYIRNKKGEKQMKKRVFYYGKNVKVGNVMELLEEYKDHNVQICESDGVVIQSEENSNVLALEGYWFSEDNTENIEDLNKFKIYNDLTAAEFKRRLQKYENKVIEVCGNREISITIYNNNISLNDIGAVLEF
jgi:hydroxymethylpyrimidine pyrophosphatase-like HAD family hydrolase